MRPENYITDQMFSLVEPILEERKDPRGRKPEISNRQVLEAYFYILREGCAWRSLPRKYGPWMRIFMRYKRWVEKGILWKLLMRLQKAKFLTINIKFTENKEQMPRTPNRHGHSRRNFLRKRYKKNNNCSNNNVIEI